MPEIKHPIQPIYNDNGTLRFKKNKIVRLLLDTGKLNLNDISIMVQGGAYSVNDFEQFIQLIGYSLDGFGDISLVSHETYQEASNQEMNNV